MPTRALALPGALLVLLLAGCAAGGASPGATGASEPAAEATALIGPVWTVEATGVDAGTTARFDDTTIAVEEGSTSSTLTWAAQGDELLATRSTASLNGAVPTGWLTGAARIEPAADGWRLVDADGASLAVLTAAGGSASGEPVPAVTAGSGVADEPASAITGRWALDGHPRSAITFRDGTWEATASCETATPGGSGAYRVLPEGRILVTRAISLRLGCPIGLDRSADRATAILGVTRAASFTVDGDTLTLFDRTGSAIGSLVR